MSGLRPRRNRSRTGLSLNGTLGLRGRGEAGRRLLLGSSASLCTALLQPPPEARLAAFHLWAD
jgi:hypothetical protein